MKKQAKLTIMIAVPAIKNIRFTPIASVILPTKINPKGTGNKISVSINENTRPSIPGSMWVWIRDIIGLLNTGTERPIMNTNATNSINWVGDKNPANR